MARKLLVESTEYLRVPVYGQNVGSLTPSDFEIAVTMRRAPLSTDWHAASGFDGISVSYMVGPLSAHGVLELGDNTVYVRVLSTPERPVFSAGTIQVTDH